MVDTTDKANAVRALAMDAVQQANSGHPGMPMGMADIATVLWQDFLKVNPAEPNWANRDRFVLSNGHGAMLLYACLHLSGYDVSMQDLKDFRQLHSKTPGHPEYAETPGVETTTGPLGQGLANAVGMALAETRLAKEFNRDDFPMIDNFTYVFAGDGCLMEGISHEACSLAGTWGLGKLLVFWDDNGISIDGKVGPWFSDNTPARFEAYNWQVIRGVDGHNPKDIAKAIENAQAETDRPTLICCRTQIGFGSPNMANTASAHGSPLGAEEIAKTKEQLGWQYGPFSVPADIVDDWSLRERGAEQMDEWDTLFVAYAKAHPELAAEFKRRMSRELPIEFAKLSDGFILETQQEQATVATRKASLQALNAYAPHLPELVGGSADLTGSNCTKWSQAINYSLDEQAGNYIRYGVREFGMAAIMNGMALTGGHIPFGGTFLTFLDYARNAVRLSALMQQRVVYVFSHDSIGLGEDGPTHQPIEHANMLRMTPGIDTWRPADATETAVAWQQALLQANKPSALLLTRQNVKGQTRDSAAVANIKRGGYVLSEPAQAPVALIIATGSEIELAMEAQQQLVEKGIPTRVVSMPCAERFLEQDEAYQQQVLPPQLLARVATEAGSTNYWYRFVGLQGRVVGIDRFGVSAPANEAYEYLGLTAKAVAEAVEAVVTSVTA
jgi:transketolase